MPLQGTNQQNKTKRLDCVTGNCSIRASYAKVGTKAAVSPRLATIPNQQATKVRNHRMN